MGYSVVCLWAFLVVVLHRRHICPWSFRLFVHSLCESPSPPYCGQNGVSNSSSRQMSTSLAAPLLYRRHDHHNVRRQLVVCTRLIEFANSNYGPHWSPSFPFRQFTFYVLGRYYYHHRRQRCYQWWQVVPSICHHIRYRWSKKPTNQSGRQPPPVFVSQMSIAFVS